MRLFLGLVLLLLCVFIGFCLSNKYYFKRVFYNDFFNFNTLISQEIAFRQTTIINIIKKQNNKSDFYCLISDYILKNRKLDLKYLSPQEKDFVFEYLDKIGRLDKNTQLNYLESVNTNLMDKQKSSFDDDKKYKSLYIKLSFLIGLILLIVVL